MSEPRKIEGRLLMAIALLVAGGMLGALFLMSDDLQRGTGTINNAFAAASPPTSCGPESLPMNAESVSAAIALQPSAAAKPVRAEYRRQPAAAGAYTGRAETTARPASSVAHGSKPSPSYIRRPAPEPEPAQPALEALRRSL